MFQAGPKAGPSVYAGFSRFRDEISAKTRKHGLAQRVKEAAMVKRHIVAFSLTMAHSSWLWL